VDDLGALRLGRPERFVLGQVRRRGVTGFVVQMTVLSVVLSVTIVTVLMALLWGPDDPTFWPGVAMGAIVPAMVAPPVLLFTVRLAAGLDRASVLLWQAAHTDPLTRVANRRAFFDALDQRGGVADGTLEVAVVDVDAFKSINDRYGHAGGDLALEHVARWLSAYAGPGGLVARMGGDEFALVVTADLGGSRPKRERFEHDGMSYSVTLGWHHCEPGDSLEEALRHADLELYALKPPVGMTADVEQRDFTPSG
jgi:diguanylate cyclase (GGDEF)-like protein